METENKTACSAEEAAERMGMSPQEEGGMILENPYPDEGPGRAASGQSYYYIKPNVETAFHQLDCDEYWAYHAGSELEVWTIDEDGSLQKRKLGISEGAEPCIYFRKGVVFASRHSKVVDTGTLISVITVPRFSQEGLRLFSVDEVIRLYPETKSFFHKRIYPAARTDKH